MAKDASHEAFTRKKLYVPGERALFYDFIILCITKSEPASEFRMQEQTMTELTVTKTRTMKNDEDSNDDERYTKFMKAFCAGCGSEVRNE